MSTRHSATLSDGSTVSGDSVAVARVVQIDRDYRAQESAWVAELRAAGVKAAHPNDGWVNREKNYFQLAYPQFNDGLAVGDLAALGSASRGHFIVRVIRRTKAPHPIWVGSVRETGRHWYYEEVR